MFKEGKKPSLVIPLESVGSLMKALARAGYREHRGRRVARKGEITAFRKSFTIRGQRRQCHVQILCSPSPNSRSRESVSLYAHTEPDLKTLSDAIKHGVAALTDEISYAAGSRMLRRALKEVGWVPEKPEKRRRHR